MDIKEMSDSEKESVKAGIKEGLESLKGKIWASLTSKLTQTAASPLLPPTEQITDLL